MSDEKIKEEAKRISQLNNSGKVDEAVRDAKALFKENPHSINARLSQAVMVGDSAYEAKINKDEKDARIQFAISELKQMINDPNFDSFEPRTQVKIKNEYYCFSEQPLKQYELGIELMENGDESASYCACVGASMLGLKFLREKKKKEATHWAQESIKYFKEYEKIQPDWYNINFFVAQAYAILGDFDQSIAINRDMFRKKGTEYSEEENKNFLDKLDEIKKIQAEFN